MKMVKLIQSVLVALFLATMLGACGSVKESIHKATAPEVSQPTQSVATGSVTAPTSAPAPAPQMSVSTRTEAVSPQSLESLQPFKKFKKGEGEGYAYQYRSRTKAQFVALLRNPARAKKEMRVECGVVVRQMAEAHGLPFEGCTGAAAEIERNNDYKVVKCDNSMFADNALAVTSQDGKTFGTWHRKCLAGEQVLTYKGKPILSTMCLNPVVPKSRTVQVAAQQVATPATPLCTEVPKARLNIWEAKATQIAGVSDAIGVTKGTKNGYFGGDRISRGFGAKFRSENARGALARSSSPHEVVINHLKGNSVVQIYRGMVTGQYLFPLPAGFASGDVIQVVFTDMTKVVSPVSDLRAAYSEFVLQGCGPTTNLHAIER